MNQSSRYKNKYFKWLQNEYIYQDIEPNAIEIITPFLDNENDGIIIYAEFLENDSIRLTDDGWTIYQLNNYDTHIIGKNKIDIKKIINSPDIIQDNDELAVITDKNNFPHAQRMLINAILEIETIRRLRYLDVIKKENRN